jgi:hypothetical protein
MSLSDFATIAITGSGPALTRVGFGTALLLAYFTEWTDALTHTYEPDTALDTLIEEGFDEGSPVYKMMAAFCAQDPKPSQVKVGRLTSPLTQIQEFTPAVANETTYTVTVYREDTEEEVIASYTSDVDATAAEICTGLAADITGNITDITAANASGVLRLTMAAGKVCYVKDWSSNLSLIETTANASLATQIAAIRDEDDDWYALAYELHGKAPQVAIADYIETLNKIFLCQTSEDRAYGSGSNDDIGEDLQAATQGRTSCTFVLQDTGDYRAVGQLGERLQSDPGSDTWAFKTIVGSPFDALTPTQKTNLRAKNYTTYIRTAGANHTLDGKVAGGEWLDVVRFLDWFKIRGQERIVSLQLANPKVAYTQDGINSVEGEIRAQIKEGQDVGGISKDTAPSVTAPKIANVPTADKQARELNNVRFGFDLAGAIHLVRVTGTASA